LSGLYELKGSQVHLYNFDKSPSNANNISDSKGAGKAAAKGLDNADATPVIPSKNNSNSKNQINKTQTYGKQVKKNPTAKRLDKDSTRSTNNSNSHRAQTTKSPAETVQAPPSLTEVKLYFAQKKFLLPEAEKFHNYFESNGWLVGGRAPMRNWKAAARNWILNSKKFTNGKETGKLHATTNKNYSESL
jgi:hypothetical protein